MNETNLKPFEKGQSGNPAGRPKGTIRKDVNDLIAEIGVEKIRKSIHKKQMYITQLEVVVRMLYKAACSGKLEAQKFIVERLGGKAKQTVAVENALEREWFETFKRIKDEVIRETENNINGRRKRLSENIDS